MHLEPATQVKLSKELKLAEFIFSYADSLSKHRAESIVRPEWNEKYNIIRTSGDMEDQTGWNSSALIDPIEPDTPDYCLSRRDHLVGSLLKNHGAFARRPGRRLENFPLGNPVTESTGFIVRVRQSA